MKRCTPVGVYDHRFSSLVETSPKCYTWCERTDLMAFRCAWEQVENMAYLESILKSDFESMPL